MKIKVIVNENQNPNEATLTVHHLNDDIKRLIKDFDQQTILASSRGSEFPLNVHDVIFFQTEGDSVTAHLTQRAYQTKYKLYELEEILPSRFLRISKSAIVNTQKIESISRGLSASREITFHETHKVIYVSRKYYPLLKEKMEEKTL